MLEINCETISRNMKSIRIKRGMTQDDAAKLLGVSRQTLSAYENNPGQLSLADFNRLADLYDVKPNYFFEN